MAAMSRSKSYDISSKIFGSENTWIEHLLQLLIILTHEGQLLLKFIVAMNGLVLTQDHCEANSENSQYNMCNRCHLKSNTVIVYFAQNSNNLENTIC